jgi:hypothetical protein
MDACCSGGVEMNIVELATQAGMEQDGDMWFSNLYKTDMDVHISHLEAFAKLVAAHEREECAKLCDKLEQQVRNMWHGQACAGCAVTIRARNNT